MDGVPQNEWNRRQEYRERQACRNSIVRADGVDWIAEVDSWKIIEQQARSICNTAGRLITTHLLWLLSAADEFAR
jgi:hypothetical protein